MTSAKEQFDRQAAQYNAQWNAWTETSLNWLLDHADCQPTDVALDVATGSGFTALAFAPHVQSVVGLDVSTGMLAQAARQQQERGLTNVTWLEGAAEALPFPDAAFTLVTCRIAPHHFLSVPAFLAEVARVLQPGGRLLLADTTVPNDAPEISRWQNHIELLRDPSHRRNLAPQEWRQELEAAGLRAHTVEPIAGEARVNLADWAAKSGCTAEQLQALKTEFAKAPAGAAEAFQIQQSADEVTFVWQRVVAKATKG
ncbi:methyltransferase domain-containing protein [Hymenobacter sp. BT175]|uniref:class I SAM-dependent methyltransferase n=1 Tax=Hymenobacter translucens TaxID=2886507 RepID=UPI001D0E516C|nr:methyltransferase domain-containing protein [Hymenobacter translucens]MCC2547025.1 methyltransferase domain-containing protein [Hymenobacter translucens]